MLADPACAVATAPRRLRLAALPWKARKRSNAARGSDAHLPEEADAERDAAEFAGQRAVVSTENPVISPKYVWHVEADAAYEARQGAPGSGEYHGYPLQPTQSVRDLLRDL